MTYPQGTIRAFQYGLAIFALTALIGLFNATKIIGDIDRNTLLTHRARTRVRSPIPLPSPRRSWVSPHCSPSPPTRCGSRTLPRPCARRFRP